MYFKFFLKKKSIVRIVGAGPLYKKCSPFQGAPNHRHTKGAYCAVERLGTNALPCQNWFVGIFFFGGTMKKSYSANLRLYSKTVKDGPCVTFSKTLFGWSRRGGTAVLCCLSLGLTI